MSGKMYIPIIHELVCAFLDVSGAKNRTTAIPSFTTGDVSIFRKALYKDGAAKITKDLHLHGLLPESVEFLSPSQAGYQGAVWSVANQMKEKTEEIPIPKAAASELGSRGKQGAVRRTFLWPGIVCNNHNHEISDTLINQIFLEQQPSNFQRNTIPPLAIIFAINWSVGYWWWRSGY